MPSKEKKGEEGRVVVTCGRRSAEIIGSVGCITTIFGEDLKGEEEVKRLMDTIKNEFIAMCRREKT